MKRHVVLLLRLLLAYVFVQAGWAKLSGNPAMIGVFETIGLGQWFRLFTGSVELLGGLGLLLPHTYLWAARGLAVVMLGAGLAHMLVLGGSPVLPVVLLAFSWIVGRSN